MVVDRDVSTPRRQPMQVIGIHLPGSLLARLAAVADRAGLSRAEIIRAAISRGLRRMERQS